MCCCVGEKRSKKGENMPRFRFQWSNLPESLRTALAQALNMPADAEHFVKTFGKRPQEAFIQQSWEVLLQAWLPYDVAATKRIAQLLRERGLGDATVTSDDLAYLRSCRNSISLRRVVLVEFITLGEANQTDVQLPHDATPPPPQKPDNHKHPPTANTPATPVPQLPPPEQFRQYLWHVLTTHFPEGSVSHDDEGSIIVAAGSTNVFITINPDPLFARVSALLVRDVTATPDLYETLNFINRSLQFGRVFTVEGYIILEDCLFPTSAMEDNVLHTVSSLCFLADVYDDRLHETFGGTMMKLAPGGDSIDV
jgi:hypothetical protein